MANRAEVLLHRPFHHAVTIRAKLLDPFATAETVCVFFPGGISRRIRLEILMTVRMMMVLLVVGILWKKRSIDVGAAIFAVLIAIEARGCIGRVVVVQLGRDARRGEAGGFFVLSRVAEVAVDFFLFRLLLRRVQVDFFAIFGKGFPLVVVRVEDFVVVFQLGEELQPADVVLLVGNANL